MPKLKTLDPAKQYLYYYAVVWENLLIGPFTEKEEALTWAAQHNVTQVLSCYPPLFNESNVGHEIGRFLCAEEMQK